MIPRYSRPDMVAIWEPEARFRIWFEIEAHATQKLADLGVVPQSAAKALWDWWATKPAIDVAAIDAIEAITKHDVIAFLDWVAQQVGPEARFMHQGMTSSDVLDTCLAVQLARASDLLLADMDALLAAINAGIPVGDTVAWRDADDEMHDLTPAQLAELGGIMLAAVTAVYQASWAKKDALAAVTDPVEFRAFDTALAAP
jgi:hypothetical protein